jgi:hypothetical protein
MTTMQHTRRDRAHHHPEVLKVGNHWVWVCTCGGASGRSGLLHLTWRQAMVGALLHSATIAA